MTSSSISLPVNPQVLLFYLSFHISIFIYLLLLIVQYLLCSPSHHLDLGPCYSNSFINNSSKYSPTTHCSPTAHPLLTHRSPTARSSLPHQLMVEIVMSYTDAQRNSAAWRADASLIYNAAANAFLNDYALYTLYQGNWIRNIRCVFIIDMLLYSYVIFLRYLSVFIWLLMFLLGVGF